MTTNTKLFFLLLTTLLGLGSLSFMLYKQQLETEYEMKTLYFGTLIPVSSLKEISLLLQRDVVLKAYELRKELKVSKEFSHKIIKVDKKIMKLWMDYATQYKSKEEKAFVSHVDLKMQQLHTYLLNLSQKVKNFSHKETGVSFSALSAGVKSIDRLIGKLVAYELKHAHAKRKDLLTYYAQMRILLLAFIIITVFVSLLLFMTISNSIKAYERRLQHLAIDLQSANKELHTASITDDMTGLYNRRYFDQIFFNEIQRAQREGQSLTFMMVDIDHFKKYNDFYGHPAGDVVIKKVAKHLAQNFKRPNDLIFRLGGEEFGLLAIGVSYEMVSFMADKMIKDMQSLNIEHLQSETAAHLTLSLGLIHFEKAQPISAADLYEVTDKALYVAKDTGRNKVVAQSI